MDLAGQRVTVMGLGRFGGGVGVTRFLVAQGARVLVTDTEPPSALAESLARLEGLPVEYRLGEHRDGDFTSCDQVIANPAVKPDNRFLLAAREAGVPITTEIRLLVERLPDRRRVIGVTGSAGKSTVSAMIAHLLRKSGQTAWLGGNIGGSLLGDLDTIRPRDWIVLELSSFQLHHLRAEDHSQGRDLRGFKGALNRKRVREKLPQGREFRGRGFEDFRGWSPHVAVVTNITANHLDWHGSFEAYVAAKRVIVDFQQPGDRAIVGEAVPFAGTRVAMPASPIPLALPGRHNQLNAAFALAVTQGSPDALADFRGLAHRLQYVGEPGGVRCYNDSKSTTPEAAMLAIDAFEPGTVHVILGGYDKGSDLTKLARYAAGRCAGIYTLGAMGDVIADAAGDGAARCGDLETAVAQALARARRGEVVLLSPGCASWDQFIHFEARGDRFVQLVQNAAP